MSTLSSKSQAHLTEETHFNHVGFCRNGLFLQSQPTSACSIFFYIERDETDPTLLKTWVMEYTTLQKLIMRTPAFCQSLFEVYRERITANLLATACSEADVTLFKIEADDEDKDNHPLRVRNLVSQLNTKSDYRWMNLRAEIIRHFYQGMRAIEVNVVELMPRDYTTVYRTSANGSTFYRIVNDADLLNQKHGYSLANLVNIPYQVAIQPAAHLSQNADGRSMISFPFCEDLMHLLLNTTLAPEFIFERRAEESDILFQHSSLLRDWRNGAEEPPKVTTLAELPY